MNATQRSIGLLVGSFVLCVLSGCASVCKKTSCDGCDSMPESGTHRQVVRGRDNIVIDSVGSVLGFPNKIALLDRRADSHDISAHTESEITTYLQRNSLDSVLVRSNQYDPIGEWQRMAGNEKIAAPVRYTLGTYDWIKYTLLPGRLVGGDHYSPYSDTIHIYSDIPAIGLAKAAYAKDVHSRVSPTLYTVSQELPLVGMWHENIANTEVVNYVSKTGSADELEEAKKILYPDMAGTLGSQTLGFLPYGSVYGRAGGAMIGQAIKATREWGASLVD